MLKATEKPMQACRAASLAPRVRKSEANGAKPKAPLALASTADTLGRGIVRRPALARSLADAPGSSLALIVAPPGYGKSTLLTEWAELDERSFAWLALGQCESRAISTPAAGEAKRLPQLVRAMRARQGSFVVVLDDAHLAPAAVLRDVAEAALKELPMGSTLALASRTEPALAIGRMRANRLLSEIRMHQLAMSSSEATVLLRRAGLEPKPGDVEALVSHTEGWPAALYLAALALREESEELASFGGRHHLLSEYLTDEVLAALPIDLINFSVRTSVLNELSGPCCDSVLDRSHSAVLLERLARVTPLLVPVDPAHHRYRWQIVMQETLQAELERIEPKLNPVLRRRASRWYTGRGETQRAIEQAVAADDAELTGKLLWPNVLTYLTSGRCDLVQGWLSNFRDARTAEHAPLMLSASLSALVRGNVNDARHWWQAAAAALRRRNGGQELHSLATGLAVIDAVIVPDGVRRMAEIAMNAAESAPGNSPWRPVCALLRGVATHLQGDCDSAELLLDNGIRLAGNGAPAVTALCLAQRGVIALEREDWSLAAELSDRAAMLVEEFNLTSDPLLAIVFCVVAASRAHEGRVDEAKRDLRRGIDLLTTLGDFVPWYGAEARILLAHASLWLADIVGARTLLAEASRFARRTVGATSFSRWFDRAWAYMDTLAETSLAGPSSLTIAELRVLRFLPSHRPFREIAAQLGVSSNTVKTQAHAVYRKLGAASRSEAVAQARRAGLLGQ
jgi:LuxR family transcriptional regulator, maltose regulon positive regulatory protein